MSSTPPSSSSHAHGSHPNLTFLSHLDACKTSSVSSFLFISIHPAWFILKKFCSCTTLALKLSRLPSASAFLLIFNVAYNLLVPSRFSSQSPEVSYSKTSTLYTLNFQSPPLPLNKPVSRMSVPSSASAIHPPQKALVSSGSCSLLPSQTMPFLSRHLITDCHTVSHNCRPCLPSQTICSQGQRPCLSFPPLSLIAPPRLGGQGPSKKVFPRPYSALGWASFNSCDCFSCPVRIYFAEVMFSTWWSGQKTGERALREGGAVVLTWPWQGLALGRHLLIPSKACFFTVKQVRKHLLALKFGFLSLRQPWFPRKGWVSNTADSNSSWLLKVKPQPRVGKPGHLRCS